MSEGGFSSALPEGWAWATLDELQAAEPGAMTDGPFGSNLKSSHYTESGARVIRLQNIGDGEYMDEKAFVSLDHFEQLRKHEVRAGDLAIASLGNELPRACLIPDLKAPAIVKADCIRMRVHPDIDNRWLLYSLIAPQTRAYAAERIRGVGRPRLGLNEIRRIPVPVPPLEEQRRIVAALEERLSRLEAADGTLQISARRIERYLQAVLHKMTSSHDAVQLGDVLASGLTNGRSVPTRAGGFPVLRLTALSDTYVDLKQCKEGDWEESEAESFLVKQGDFLIARGNGSVSLVGRGSLVVDVPTPVAYPDTIIRARPDIKKILPGYLRIVWSSLAVRRQIESQARTTAGIHKVNQKILGAIEFPLPDPSTQRALFAQWSDIEQQARHLTHTVSASKRRSVTLRRSLLAEAFAGRLVPQEPADEPADALLLRIRAEREAAGATKSRRRSPRRTPARRTRTTDTAPASDAPPSPSADAPALALASAIQPTLDMEIPS
ncbi:restriction endonuclease subunit S [Streptomyces sp. NPDC005408]|uniref:restriction endonuclease subunit S n=1 Tax=Streptomyces sp. NPDC005408 TaxID=3155341 RepID=UPI0033B963F4